MHSSTFIFIAALFLSHLTLCAQNPRDSTVARKPLARAYLSGKILDLKTGEVLPGASVYLSDIKRGAISDAQGIFSVRNLREGRYLIEVTHLGYASIVEPVLITGSVNKDFSLVQSVVEQDAVTVTGVSAATSARRSPIPVNILKRQDLLRTASTNLIDAISRTPGVSQISTGPAISKPTIRGLGYNRLVIVNDGVRQEGQQWGDEHGIEIDEYSVNKAEVLKGPASIMYGSDALAGVINILSNTPVEEGTVKANLFSNYQSNNGLTGLHGNVAGNLNGFNWSLYGTKKSAYDYRNRYDGRVFNSKFSERNFGGYVGVNRSWGYSHLLVSKFNQSPGLTEGERDERTGKFLKQLNAGGSPVEVVANNNDFKSRDPFVPNQQIGHFKTSIDNSFRTGQGRITFNLGYQHNQRKEFGDVLASKEAELSFSLKTVNYNLQFHFPESRNWQTAIGINGMRQSNVNLGEETLIPAYTLFDIGGFIYSKKTFENLTLSGGLRADRRSLNSNELYDSTDIKFLRFSRKFTNVSASAGLSYEPGKEVTLKFNVARGFRAPSIPELASNGAHEGTNRYEYGNNGLKSETSLQFDAGIDINTAHVSLSGNLFYNGIRNFIYYRKLSSSGGGDSIVQANGNDNFAFIFSQNNAKLYGAEFNIDIHPHPLDWLHIENTFSYTRGLLNREQDGSKNLPFIPAARLVNQLRADFSRKGTTIKNAYVSIELDNTFAQNHPFTGFATETRTPSYSLLNAGFGGDVMRKGKPLFSLYFAVNNLADKAYQNHLSRLKYTSENRLTGRLGVFNMGRNVSVKVNIPFVYREKK